MNDSFACGQDRMLEYPEFQHPIVLQLGGSSPEKLSKAAQLAKTYGYDEINLKCAFLPPPCYEFWSSSLCLLESSEVVSQFSIICEIPQTLLCWQLHGKGIFSFIFLS
jgi:tRNA-dihydrouridine synthase A